MKRIEEWLNGVSSLLVTGHVRPDGDCVGACLGIKNYLEAAVPELNVTVCLEEFSPNFRFLRGADDVVAETDASYDLCLVMDASSRDRLSEGVLPAFEKAGKTACIDHHITNTGYTDITFVKPEASSTCEVLCGLLEDSYITKETAECLYLGIVHDTGVFKHSNTTEHTMKEAGRMISFGARPEVIIDDTFYKKTFLQNKILGKALERAELYLDGSVIASFLSLEEMEEFGLSGKDLDGIIDQLRVTEGTEAAVFLYELKEMEYKVSLRANGRLDVSRVASAFGGGGHIKAAGCQLTGSPDFILSRLFEELKKQL